MSPTSSIASHLRALAASAAIAVLCGGEAPAQTAVAEGLIVPLHEVTVAANARKRIVEVNAGEGEQIEEGAVLAELESVQERIEVRRLEKVLQSRKFDHEAGQKLLGRAMISKEEALDRQLEFEIAELQLEAAQAALERCSIVAPLSGAVVRRLKEPGESTTESEPMFEIVDVSKVFAQIHLPRDRGNALKEGQSAVVTVRGDAGESWEVEGTVHFLSPVRDGASGLRRCKILLDNADGRIEAGMRAGVELPEP